MVEVAVGNFLGAFGTRIPDDEISVAETREEGSFFGVTTVEFGGVGGGQFNEFLRCQTTFKDTIEKERKTSFQTGKTVGNKLEVTYH
jgi:hypothetical protein